MITIITASTAAATSAATAAATTAAIIHRRAVFAAPAAAVPAAAVPAAPAPTAVSTRPVMIGHYNLTGAAREVYRHLYRAGIAGKVAKIAAEKIGSEPTPERLQLFLCRPRLWSDALHINFTELMAGNYAAARAEMVEA